MLVNSKHLLVDAVKEGYAVPAYNINNLEWARVILQACNEDRSPVILGVTSGTIKYMGGYKVIANTVKSLINELNIKVPVVLHLDHAVDFESCKKAIDAGFTSVMIDASNKVLEENINETIKVVQYANEHGVSVEAELGSLGTDDEKTDESDYAYCEVQDCIEFTSETGIDSLAPAIGNAHGIYKGEPKLNFELLGTICKEVKIPLVLHGASGLDDNKIKTAIFCGVAKININTDLQIAWANDVKKYILENNEEYDPRKLIGSGLNAIKNTIHEKNNLLGSKNQAF